MASESGPSAARSTSELQDPSENGKESGSVDAEADECRHGEDQGGDDAGDTKMPTADGDFKDGDVLVYCLLLLAFALLNGYASHHLLKQGDRLEVDRAGLMSSLNRTGRSNPRLLFFNRPTKVGSTTFVHWLLRLSSYGRGNPRAHKEVDNDFDFFFYSDSRQDPNTDHERTLMTPEEERETANYISRQACPPGRACSFYKHMFFVDYENFNLTNPIYVSLVRHPVDRQISWYYYVRSAKYVSRLGGSTLPRLKVSLDDCVTGRKQCQLLLNRSSPVPSEVKWDEKNEQHGEEKLKKLSGLDRLIISRIVAMQRTWTPKQLRNQVPLVMQDEVTPQLSYFCGYGPECGPGDPSRRLAAAMRNVEGKYAVVGVLEDMDVTIQVLQDYVPRFFSGLASPDFYLRRENENLARPASALSPRARSMLERHLWDEIEFYHFCRQRLRAQHRALHLR